MAIAFISLHTGKPDFQLDREVSYAGYVRLPIEYDNAAGEVPQMFTFAPVEDDTDEVVTYCAVGAAGCGQGEIFMRVPILPNIPILAARERQNWEWWAEQGMTEEQAKGAVEVHGLVAPRVYLCNTNPVKLPDNLNPIARVVHKLIYAGLICVDELHPKLFEAVNDALHNAGVPVLQVVRNSAAKMDVRLDQMPSLQDLGVRSTH